MPEIVYLTGAPATGKTTLGNRLAEATGISLFSYGSVLTQRLAARVATQAELRRQSSAVITFQDVLETDRLVVEGARQAREARQSLVVDSHAVTKEAYGFRCIPYDTRALHEIGFTVIVCLYAAPEVVAERITMNSDGRPLPNLYELEAHNEMQRSLALAYAHSLGRPCHFVDSDGEPERLAAELQGRLAL